MFGRMHREQSVTLLCRPAEPEPGNPKLAIFAGAGAAFKILLEPESELELVVNLVAPAPGLFCALTIAMVCSCCATNSFDRNRSPR